MASFVGLRVSATLHNNQVIVGTIQEIDTSRNVVILTTSDNKRISLDRSSIASLSTVQASSSSSHTSSSPSIPPKQQQYHNNNAAPDVSHLPRPSRKKKNNNGKPKKDHTSQATVPMEDFDFEASAKSFNKAKIWEQIRKTHADEDDYESQLLVSHNRIGGKKKDDGGGGNGMMRKLRNDENVLSPQEDDLQEKDDGDVRPVSIGKSIATNGHPPQQDQQVAILQRQVRILESLSNITLTPLEQSATDVSFHCTTQSSATSDTLAFKLQSSLQEDDHKVRYIPISGQDAIPEKYQRELGLRLDNSSARIFIQRLRGQA
ncbi:unnamed protein product [Sympodiomycopsis kandeliae]